MGQRNPPLRVLSIFQLPCISIFVDDVEMDAKRGGKLEIFLSLGDVALVGGFSPSSTAFDVARRKTRKRMTKKKWE